MKMDHDKLLKNMVDQIKEAQLKLGYAKETVRLYYPLSSLNAILGTDYADGREMLCALGEAFREESVLGKISFALNGSRVEAGIPPKGAEYVHMHVKNPVFLADLIELFRQNPHCGIEDIRRVFDRSGQAWICEKPDEETAENMGFDAVFYFEDPAYDAYYYCFKEEMGHMVYHRFSGEDYRLMRE